MAPPHLRLIPARRRHLRPHGTRAVALSIALAGAVATLPWAPRVAGAEGTAPLPVVVSIHPLALLVQEVGGDAVAVRTLLPAGASPHGYEPSPSDVRALSNARLLVTVGGGLDPWAARLARGLDLKGARLALAEQGPLRPSDATHVHADEDGHDEGPGDPHVWLDPLWVRDHAVPALERALAAAAPDQAGVFHTRAHDFTDRLTALDRVLADALAPVRGEAFIAFHGSWGYFAARYGLNQVAVVEPLPGREPSAHWMAQVVRAAQGAGARVVLVEPEFNPRSARTIAEQFGGRMILVDPLGNPRVPWGDTYAGATYEGLMRFNADAFVQGLAR